MLLELAQSAIDAGEQCALATVVRLDGSGYGRPGARLVITESGERAGYISGGCLEKDLCHRVWDATVRGPKLIAFDTRGNTVNPGRYNTGCDGVVYVLCQRLHQQGELAIAAMQSAIKKIETVKFGAVYRSESAALRIGDSVAVYADGSAVTPLDSLGEGRRQNIAKLCRIVEESVGTKSVLITNDEGATVEIFIEVIEPPSELVVFGAGDDVIPLYNIARQLGWSITIVGRRTDLADPKRFPSARLYAGHMPETAARLAIGSRTKCVLMTHDFDQDVQLLPILLDSPADHIGILGPKRRLGKLVWQVAQRGRMIDACESSRIHAPIGLDIGAANPQEIAVSIVAEFIARSRNRCGGFLHDRRKMLNPSHVVENRINFEIEPLSPVAVQCESAICEALS
jgi:xanthine dehydrogenase accessory factor